MSLKTENNAITTLDGSLSSASTNLVLNSVSGFPQLDGVDDFCILTIIRESDGSLEYVKCNSLDAITRTYTVERAQEGSVALNFADGDEVRNLLTRDQIEYLAEDDFPEYFDGFTKIGRHRWYVGNIDDILVNSIYNTNSASATGDLPPFSISEWFFLHTMVHTAGTTSATQMAYSMNSGEGEIFIRHLTNGSWFTWRKLALADDLDAYVPLAGNVANPMTGDLHLADTAIFGASFIEMGNEGVDSANFIDFRSSSDPSQADYSARIIRGSGVAGAFTIRNLGTGDMFITSGNNIVLQPLAGVVSFNNALLINVSDPINALDATNKQYVDAEIASAIPSGVWAKIQNGTGVPTVQRGVGVTGISRVSNTYTMTLSSAINSNKDIILGTMNGEEGDASRSCVTFLKNQSTTTSIVFQLVDNSGGANNASDFYISLTELN